MKKISNTNLPRRIDGRPTCFRVGLAPRGDLSRPGTAATEFAITLPLVLLLALAICDFGRIAQVHQVLVNAARTGAESGATHQYTDFTQPSWEADIRQAVVDEMANLRDFDEAEMIYDLSTTVDADGVTQIAVEVSYPFRTIVAWPALPTEVMLHKHVEFRQFR